MTVPQFPVRLRVAMAVAGIHRTELAKRLDVSPQAVAKWCLGQSWPCSCNLMAICRETGCSLDWLMDATPIDIRSPSEAVLRERRDGLVEEIAALRQEETRLYKATPAAAQRIAGGA